MYLVANISRSHIVIRDLGISIEPKQALDLHKMKCLIDPDVSEDLKLCKKTGRIKILKKSKKRNNETVVVQEKSSFDQEKLLEAIGSLVKGEIQKQITDSRNENQDKLLSTLGDITSLIKNQKQTIITQEGQIPKQEDEEVFLDEDKMAEMHARTMNKIAGDAETKVDYEDQEVVDSSFSDNLSELEDLL